jgi:hypothetical protein
MYFCVEIIFLYEFQFNTSILNISVQDVFLEQPSAGTPKDQIKHMFVYLKDTTLLLFSF